MAIIPAELTLKAWRQAAWERQFEDLARRWEKRLNLSHWTISWSMADCINEDPDVTGHVHVRTEHGHEAEITIADCIADCDERVRAEVLVHELLHIHLDELFAFSGQYLEGAELGYMRRLVEIAVADLARILVDLVIDEEAATEPLAEYMHEAWSGWMQYLFEHGTQNDDGTFTIDFEQVGRWRRQMNMPYGELPEAEKDSDRIEANRILAVIRDNA